MPLLQSISQHSIKLLILAKIIVISFVVASTNGWLYFGDKKLSAEESSHVSEQSNSSDTNGNKTTTADNTEEESDTEGDEEDNKRRGFLDNLLKLPKLKSADKLKKDEIGVYLHLIETKKNQVEDRIRVLSERENQLKQVEVAIDEKLKKIEEEMIYFKQTIQKEKEIKEERLKSIIEFYQKMEPKKAAPIFEKLDKDLVTALFKAMPKKQVINILQLMKSDKSVELSEYYGRIRSGTEYETLKEINSNLRKEFDECKGLPKDQN